MPIEHDRDIVVVSGLRRQSAQDRVGHGFDGQIDGVGHHLGDTVDLFVDGFVAPFDQAVGVQQQRRSRRQRAGGLRPGLVAMYRQRHRAAVGQQLGRRRTGGEHRRHMPGAAVAQASASPVSTMATNTVVQNASGMNSATESSCSSSLAGSAPVSKQRARRRAQLAHHRRGGQAAADAVADDDADAVVADGQHVVEVAADLQRRHRGLVAHGEAGGQRARRQHRALQRQRRLARDLELPDMLHRQAEMPDKRRDELPVLRR